MRLFGPLARTAAFAGLALTGMFAALPASAGPAEVALLESYVGSWTGRGQVTGSRSETLVCKLTIKPGTGEKVNFSGRCAVAGATMSVNGTMLYADAARRFEAAMTATGGYTGVAVGRRSGDNVVFNLREKNADADGRAVDVTAAITLNAARITVDFNVTFNDSGETMQASVPFTQ
jgi:hypothetical protein